ncbi:transposase, partial [Corynebacterium striatum]
TQHQRIVVPPTSTMKENPLQYRVRGTPVPTTRTRGTNYPKSTIEAQVLKLIQDIPHTEILLSMPGIGPRSAAQILMTVGDMSDFPDAAHLASYAGLSPRTNQSGTSIMSNSPNRDGNKKLKNALWQSSFASIRFHERSRQFYERKRKEGKRHNAAVVALARRRLNVLFAMMRSGELYRDISTVQEVTAA